MYPNYPNQNNQTGFPTSNIGAYPVYPNNFGFDGLISNNEQYPPYPIQNQPQSFAAQNLYPNPQQAYPNPQQNQPYPNIQNQVYPNIGGNFFQQSCVQISSQSQAIVSDYSSKPIYPIVNYEGTVKPIQPFNPSDDAARLYKAMKGLGTDEKTLIDILCRRTSQQRQEIAMSYKTGYGKDLLKNLKDETRGKFEDLLEALMLTPIQLEARDLRKAIEGLGTDEISLIDIICTKTNSEMSDLKAIYKQMYNKILEEDVGGDVSGYFKRFLVSLIAAHRSDAQPDHQKAIQQAKDLQNAGEKRLGTDEVTFNRIFASESFPHLKLVFQEYQKLTGHDIDKAIKSEMSGDVERAFLAVAGIAKNPPAYYAERLYQTMKGLGTNDRQLIRLMVLRSEKDMVQIKNEFQKLYGKTLESFIKGDCSGDYKKGLLCLAGDSNWK